MLTPTPTKVWWRKDPLTKEDELLLAKLFQAHIDSAFRDNASSVAVANAAFSSGDLAKAIAAGLLTLGGRHAPLEETYHFLSLDHPYKFVNHFLKDEAKIPGWGGTFQKDKPDPIWQPVDQLLQEYQPELYQKIEEVTNALHKHDKIIFPNPSAYTAATAITVRLDVKLAAYLFIAGRLDAWVKIASNYIKGGVPISEF